jgi:hypothetical protein
MDQVIAAGKKLQHTPGVTRVLRFFKHFVMDADHGVRPEHDFARRTLNRTRFGLGKPTDKILRRFAWVAILGHTGCPHNMPDSSRGQQLASARRSGCKN